MLIGGLGFKYLLMSALFMYKRDRRDSVWPKIDFTELSVLY